ncbi:ATP-binding protein [Virgibacillus phasianinus]|nr:sensor histidine kinase [Virgibacillus phasianinus]
MKRLLNVSLQVKILGLIISLILLIVGLITTTFVILESKEDIKKAESIALQTAKTLSYMPVVHETIISNDQSEEIQSIADHIVGEVNASAILIENRDGRLFNEVPSSILDRLSNDKHKYRTLVFGSAYATNVGDGADALLIGMAPIYIDYGMYGKVEGTVAVVYKMETIMEDIAADTKKILIISFGVLLAGIFGGVMLTRSIRKDTFGLEPIEIASLYRERNAIIQSIKEGIVAIDSSEKFTMMNNSAKQILDIKTKVKGQSLIEVFHSPRMINVLRSQSENNNVELEYNGKTIIVNSQPIKEGSEKLGTVASFRDKTEIQKMVNTLSEVKQYSEDLRAQTHEFKNKLYVLLGLIQLEKFDEAMQFIKVESKYQEVQADIIFNHIRDEKIQAILLGKIAKASESKTEFIIDSDSSLSKLPGHFELLPLLIIIGNLIDNAFEAVSKVKEGEVSFFTTDIGNDIIFEVVDNGSGIDEKTVPFLFEKGFSEKGENRGYGLSNVKKEIESLGGSIELQYLGEEGTIFTVFIPKRLKQTKLGKGDESLND